MSASMIYRRQHDDILKLVGTISANLQKDTITNKTEDVLNLLSELSAKIVTHLTMEDKALYPKLVSSGNPKAKTTAEAFIQEMGGIKDVFQVFVGKWSNPTNLRNEPEAFIAETKGLFQALGARIDRENSVLYPLFDAI